MSLKLCFAKKSNNNRVVANDEHIFACNLCEYSMQHQCRRCNVPVCNLKCSIKDAVSDNKLHRIHREGDPRYKCPKYDDTFNQQETLDNHLYNEHSRFTAYSEL